MEHAKQTRLDELICTVGLLAAAAGVMGILLILAFLKVNGYI